MSWDIVISRLGPICCLFGGCLFNLDASIPTAPCERMRFRKCACASMRLLDSSGLGSFCFTANCQNERLLRFPTKAEFEAYLPRSENPKLNGGFGWTFGCQLTKCSAVLKSYKRIANHWDVKHDRLGHVSGDLYIPYI